MFSKKKKKKAQASSLIKTRPVGAEFFHADGHDGAKSLFAISRTRLKTS
jgi:hypothetical protein